MERESRTGGRDGFSPRGSLEMPSRQPRNQLEDRDARRESRGRRLVNCGQRRGARDSDDWHRVPLADGTKATVAAAVTAAAQASPPRSSFPFFFFSFPLSSLPCFIPREQSDREISSNCPRNF